MKMYKVNSLRDITPVEYTRKTNFYIWFINHRGVEVRESIQCNWYNYFDTYADARQFLIDKALQKIEWCKKALDNAHKEYSNIESIPTQEP